MTSTRLLLATNNRGKLVEIQALMNLPGWELVLPVDLNIHLDVAETGATYAENAALKARAFCETGMLLTLADDSGLEVAALNGAPGLHSARFGAPAGIEGGKLPSDAARRAYLLERLKGLAQPWKARFCCTVAIAVPRPEAGIEIMTVEGFCTGEIIPEERGTHGFGYDPIFFIPEFGCTMAELPLADKNRISHRARAIQAALPLLTALQR